MRGPKPRRQRIEKKVVIERFYFFSRKQINNKSNDGNDNIGHWILLLFNLKKKECLLVENLAYIYENRLDIKQVIDTYCTSHKFLLKHFNLKTQNVLAKGLFSPNNALLGSPNSGTRWLGGSAVLPWSDPREFGTIVFTALLP